MDAVVEWLQSELNANGYYPTTDIIYTILAGEEPSIPVDDNLLDFIDLTLAEL